MDLYMKPSSGLRLSGCRMWSESLNWHKTLSFIGGPMLIDTQLFSTLQRPLQEARIPKLKEIFLITWPCRAYPSTGVVNLRWRQRSVNKKTRTKCPKYTLSMLMNEMSKWKFLIFFLQFNVIVSLSISLSPQHIWC